MKGRQKGRPVKWVDASIEQCLDVDRAGISFLVYNKWKRKRVELGTLRVSVGGFRWLPASGKRERRRSWNQIAEWLG
jgi:hypothetical protein